MAENRNLGEQGISTPDLTIRQLQKATPLSQGNVRTSPVPVRKLRRRESFSSPDSSSSAFNSTPESFYNAYGVSSGSSDENVQQDFSPAITRQTSFTTATTEDEDSSRNMSTSTTIFRYGNGTVLDTILEQRSNASIRLTPRTKSFDDLRSIKTKSSVSGLNYSNSCLSVQSESPRKRSFSLDDVDLLQPETSPIEETNVKPRADTSSAIHEIYARPHTPLASPLQRPNTPPGMPSWTEAQLLGHPGHLRPQTMFERFFGMRSARSDLSRQLIPPVSRSLDPEQRPRSYRFRPPRSPYIPLQAHPYSRVAAQKPDPFPPWLGRSNNPTLQSRSTPPAVSLASDQVTASGSIGRQNLRRREARSRRSEGSLTGEVLGQTENVPEKPRSCSHQRKKAKGKSIAGGSPLVPRTALGIDVDGQTEAEGSGANSQPRQDENRNPTATGALEAGELSTTTAPCVAEPSSPSERMSYSPLLGAERESKSSSNRCWKCRLAAISAKVDDWWTACSSITCYRCCGAQLERDGDVIYSAWGSQGAGYGHDNTYVPPRPVRDADGRRTRTLLGNGQDSNTNYGYWNSHVRVGASGAFGTSGSGRMRFR